MTMLLHYLQLSICIYFKRKSAKIFIYLIFNILIFKYLFKPTLNLNIKSGVLKSDKLLGIRLSNYYLLAVE